MTLIKILRREEMTFLSSEYEKKSALLAKPKELNNIFQRKIIENFSDKMRTREYINTD